MLLKTAVEKFCVGYFATNDRSDRTRRAYSIDLKQFLAFSGARVRLTTVAAATVESWIASLRSAGYAPASIRRKAASLRVFFLYWCRRGTLSTSPMWHLRLSLAGPRLLPKCLTASEMGSLLAAAQAAVGERTPSRDQDNPGWFQALRNLALVDLLFATGMRVGEAAAIDIADFRREDLAFSITGKGRRVRLAFLIDPTTIEIQNAHLRARNRLSVSEPALFLNSRGSRLSTQGAAYALRSLARAAGIDRRVTPHMLRHTVATLLLRNGADLRVVQEFLGHASITSTQRYTHVSKRHLQEVLRARHPVGDLRQGTRCPSLGAAESVR